MDEVKINKNAIMEMEDAGVYIYSLLGYCDGRTHARHAKVKKKFQSLDGGTLPEGIKPPNRCAVGH